MPTAVTLSDVAQVNLGYITLLNDFHYVTKDTIDLYGIESEFLKEVYRLGDLQADQYVQTGAPATWLFDCRKAVEDLRGTGALAYIRWGQNQKTRPKKQSEQAVSWPDAPALASRKYWYAPTTSTHASRVALRKAVGDRYAPFLFDTSVVLDQRMYALAGANGVSDGVLQAYLCSSLFPLSLETNADLQYGAGALSMNTSALRELPTLDLRILEANAVGRAHVLESLAELVKSRPMRAGEYQSRPDVLALDSAILAALGWSEDEAKDKALAAAVAVAELSGTRLTMPTLREKSRTEAKHADITTVAEDVAAQLRSIVEGFTFPPVSMGVPIALPKDHALTVSIEIIMQNVDVTIIDDLGVRRLALEGLDHSTAEVLLRALQLGRREFTLPVTEAEAESALEGLAQYLEDLGGRFDEVSGALVASERLRDQVLGRVGELLHVQFSALGIELSHGDWHIGPAT
jgi:hypothetical protein